MGNRAHWGSRLAFILAAAGSAIGLGNIWKFPYIAGINGGGAFVLIYLACIAVVGVPILIAELYIGQKSQKNNIEAFQTLHPHKKKSWNIVGWMGLVSAFLILAFYGVVGGWILDFEYRSIIGAISQNTPEETVKGMLGDLFNSPIRKLVAHFIFMALVVGIVIGGVKEGLERWNKILMPTLLGILGFLLVYTMTMDSFGEAMSFLFTPDFSKLTAEAVLEAVGHSFFTLSLGMGTIIVYGSYLSEKEDLLKVSLMVAFLDTLIALAAGIVIFTLVFKFGIEPSGGPGLIFVTLPMLFSQITGGQIVSILFFLLVSFAALTSAVSILEVVVAYWSETRNTSRVKTTLSVGGVVFLLGLLALYSYNEMESFFTNSMGTTILGSNNFFDLFDTLTSKYLLPLGGVFISLFFGWILGKSHVNAALEGYPQWAKTGLLIAVRFVAPIAVSAVFISKVFAG